MMENIAQSQAVPNKVFLKSDYGVLYCAHGLCQGTLLDMLDIRNLTPIYVTFMTKQCGVWI